MDIGQGRHGPDEVRHLTAPRGAHPCDGAKAVKSDPRRESAPPTIRYSHL